MISRTLQHTQMCRGTIRHNRPIALPSPKHQLQRFIVRANPTDKKSQNLKDEDKEDGEDDDTTTEGEVMGLLTRDVLLSCFAYWMATLQPELTSSWHYDLSLSQAASAVAWGLIPLGVTAGCILLPDRNSNPFLQGQQDEKFLAAVFEQSGEVELIVGDDEEMTKLEIKDPSVPDPLLAANLGLSGTTQATLQALQCYWIRPFSEPESDTATTLFLLARTLSTGAAEVLLRGLFVGWLANEIQNSLLAPSTSGWFALFMKLAGLNNDGASEAAAVIVLLLICLPLTASVQIKSGVRFVRALANKPRADRALKVLKEASAESKTSLSIAASSDRVKEFMQKEGLDAPSLAALISGSNIETQVESLATSADLVLSFQLADETKAELEKASNEIQDALKSISSVPIESKEEAVKKGKELMELSGKIQLLAQKVSREGGSIDFLDRIQDLIRERERLTEEVKGLIKVESPEDRLASKILALLSISSLLGINASFCLSGFNLGASFITAVTARVLPIILIETSRRASREVDPRDSD